MLDFLDQALALAERPEFVSGPLPPAPIERFSRRGLSYMAAATQQRDYMPIEAFGDLFMGVARAYLADPNPEEMLLIQGPAGVGKSHWAAALAEEVALAGYHVLYAAPYRSFWLDMCILAMTVRNVLARNGIQQAGHATMSKFRGSGKHDGG